MDEYLVISEEKYNKPKSGVSITGNLVEIIGEKWVEYKGDILKLYIYNIIGYTAKNGKPFESLDCNIFVD